MEAAITINGEQEENWRNVIQHTVVKVDISNLTREQLAKISSNTKIDRSAGKWKATNVLFYGQL